MFLTKDYRKQKKLKNIKLIITYILKFDSHFSFGFVYK